MVHEVATMANSLSTAIIKDGSLAQTVNSPSLLGGLQNLATAAENARKRLQPKELLDFAEQEQSASNARMWLVAAAVLALASAVVQVAVLLG
jgi:hypothetical protein